MARKRGFFAEYQRQVRLAEQRQRQLAQHAARAERERQVEVRRKAQEQRAAERAEAAAIRQSERDRKRREREAVAAHQVAMQAEVDDLNDALEDDRAELEGILAWTLAVDDYVDLETLRVTAEHPPFDDEHLRQPTPLPAEVPDPPRPEWQPPMAALGFLGRKFRQGAEAAADEEYRLALEEWEREMADLAHWRSECQAIFEDLEGKRQRRLEDEFAIYLRECAAREKEAKRRNKELDALIVGLGYGTTDAVNEYIGIVLANSVYPENFQVEHDGTFEPAGAELTLRVTIPAPDSIPSTKAYRYVKTADEILATPMASRELRERYADLVDAIALRTLHEVFESDRRGIIQSISLEIGTSSISPATGHLTYVPLLGVATSREIFGKIDLSAIVPSATLEHLNAVVSKNPFGLVPANINGIRKG